ncbi:tRNA (uridine(34)/cytosine(34)/5-carboxymethylaminomethyluridine(34)-2'-O)-methyltransferase TrmL [Saccharomonospora piscinae]|uniref:Putative tRNA (cytidine(34)-2'-O)-methyltransferase n=1 Tax=Saccharomonospora piscinae TaxID=687388 RepID=A0A1V9A9I1_SACPI|nr:tRNA (cytidine(34)-2'-O)-methyltransferase [Saccharomonospora piscinae]OQO93787.1 tRNA (uridine(34)/cytosine(34)/5-carboxymethylaminomethyluridine(34)-2'-O)-methyltransferase TrmL [Saccharomonospora piscinae]
MFRIVFFHPEIPGNTGNAIRLAANTGCELHLIEPLGFSLEDRYLRRAGLDYHDLAEVRIHRDLEAAWQALAPERVHAFTARARLRHTDVSYAAGDVLLFGPESVGLPSEVLADRRITGRVRLPMVPASRSLNLTNTASVAVYEAWRQHDFAGAGSGQPLADQQ